MAKQVRLRPAQKKAYQFIIEKISSPPSTRLSPIPVLAKECGVSPATMWKTLQTLHHEGIVSIVPGGGIFINRNDIADINEAEKTDSVNIPHSRWQQIKQELSSDILKRLHPPGSYLPPCKELCKQYHTTYTTLIKALKQLLNEGRLIRENGGYRVYRHVSIKHRSTIVFIAQQGIIEILRSLTMRSQQYWRVLEDECRHLDIHLAVYNFEQKQFTAIPLALPDRNFLTIEQQLPVLGYLVWAHGFNPELRSNLFAQLQHSEKPVSVLDETGDSVTTQLFPLSRRSNRFALFRLACTKQCGKDMAHFLLNLGHTRFTIFIPAPGGVWSRERYRGIHETIIEAGIDPNAITLIHYPQFTYSFQVQSGKIPQSLTPDINEKIELLNAALEKTWHDKHGDLQRFLSPFLDIRYIRTHLHPLFSDALQQNQKRFSKSPFKISPSSCAWICCTDTVALAACDFLHEHGFVPGRDISVVGFDDIVDAVGHGLTSYNFNVPSVVEGMVGHLLRYPSSSQKHQPIKEYPGIVMQRYTA